MRGNAVYLAGPIAGLTYNEAQDWRDAVKHALIPHAIRCYSPLRGKAHVLGSSLRLKPQGGDVDHPLFIPRAILGRDFYDVTRCDCMIANLLGATTISIGTVIELGFAHAARVPVVLVMEDEGNVHDHVFVREIAAYQVDTLEKAVVLAAGVINP
jgi:nucleoside 2-deoxyribosyltransferase